MDFTFPFELALFQALNSHIWLEAIILDSDILVALGRYFPFLLYIFLSLTFACRNMAYFQSVRLRYYCSLALYSKQFCGCYSCTRWQQRISTCLSALTTWNGKWPCKSQVSPVVTSHRQTHTPIKITKEMTNNKTACVGGHNMGFVLKCYLSLTLC